ncbi:hypothetical protein KEM56_004476 [Ascosphaera pollenicola]|nr:hypothetical protein KEM56_004476 [Ascosphaera pollenicola]
MPSWSPLKAGINPSEKSIEPGANPDTPTTVVRGDDRALFEYGNMGPWANARARTTANEENYNIPAAVSQGPPGSWNSNMGDTRQGIMTTQGPATDLRARVWPQQNSSDHLPKMYGVNHGGVGQSNLELLPTAAAPRGAANAHHGTGPFEYPWPHPRYVQEYGHFDSIAPVPAYAIGPPQANAAGTPPSVKARAPSWCGHYASESPEVPEPVLARPSSVAPGMPPILPFVPGHSSGPMPEAQAPAPPPSNTSRSGRKRAEFMLEGIPAVIHPTPYKCEWPGCNDRFRRNEHLKRHMTSHTGEKPFVCWIPGCGKSFSRSDNLNVHYSTTHSKRGGRNRYVATLDENSEYYDPSYRGDLTPEGLPIGRHSLSMETPSPGKQQQLDTSSSMP